MFSSWTSHFDYCHFITHYISTFDNSERLRFRQFEASFYKLTTLNLDPVGDKLKPFYSSTGRPACLQAEIFRSFILMMDLKFTSLTNWVKFIQSDPILKALIGCNGSTPSLGAHYDFINRLWLNKQPKSNRLLPYNRSFIKGKSKKPAANSKLPNKNSGSVEKMATFLLKGRLFSKRPERLLQELFDLIAVQPSLELGLIPKENLTVSGDGTSVHCHSSKYGVKVCNCKNEGIFDCKCNRRFPDTDARIGWDSSPALWYYGYTLYTLAVYNPKYKIDLPVCLRFVGANRHDSITGIVTLAEFRALSPNLKVHNLCFDSANDNYPTYELCREWHIQPFIDLNRKRGADPKYPTHLTINDYGIPTCTGGHLMVHNGYCKGRRRHKWRCPLNCKKISDCSMKSECSPSEYGRVIYTKPDWDIRLFTPVPRGTKAYKEIYKQRTSCERMNNRILNDYKLHNMGIRSKKRYSFFTMMIGINIHLDARLKVEKFEIA